jgi:transglutaminase-like putative cysteine protease
MTRSKPVLVLFLVATVGCQPDPLSRAVALEEEGGFQQAAVVLMRELERSDLTDAERRTLGFELDRLHRIKLDYPDTKETLYEELRSSIRDLTPEEFDRWIVEGRFDMRMIDDTLRFMYASRSNLFWRYADVRARRISPPDGAEYEQSVWETCRLISDAASREGTPYVLPKTFSTRMRIRLSPHAVPTGQTIRAWLPIPRLFPHQRGFKLESTSPPVAAIAPESSPIRSAYFETKGVKDSSTVFEIQYRYTTFGVRFGLDPGEARPYEGGDVAIDPYLAEGPHVVFSDEMRDLSGPIVGSETNPLLIAKRFYDWISDSVKYSYATEYSTIDNIGDYCLTRRYGDCGQEALLLITLCRMNGIPARWQSGWYTFPGGKTVHDWTELYLQPYGWIPVDPYMGILAMQYFSALGFDQRREIRDFFFGGLDQYRMAANSDHCQDLEPPKQSFRSDVVDFQRGEVESEGKNIYFDQYSYSLVIEEGPVRR